MFKILHFNFPKDAFLNQIFITKHIQIRATENEIFTSMLEEEYLIVKGSDKSDKEKCLMFSQIV